MNHPETRLESVEDVRRALAAVEPASTVKKQGIDSDTLAFKPVHRPPMATLCVLDDGSDDGERVRIRGNCFVIGRSEGDLIIPHDPMLSSRHAEISRVLFKGGFRWLLSDLGSTNGTFARISESLLHHGQEFLLGSRRYRFNSAAQGIADLATTNNTKSPVPQETQGWKAVAAEELFPSLMEMTPEGQGKRILLTAAENVLGRDSKHCNVPLGNDPMLSPRHARLVKDAKGKWKLENAGSRNGTWIRINKVSLDGSSQFQLGEQRFIVKVLS